MSFEVSHSVEAEIDREVEELIGKRVRGVLEAPDAVKLSELQDRRLRLMRPRELKRSGGVHLKRPLLT